MNNSLEDSLIPLGNERAAKFLRKGQVVLYRANSGDPFVEAEVFSDCGGLRTPLKLLADYNGISSGDYVTASPRQMFLRQDEIPKEQLFMLLTI